MTLELLDWEQRSVDAVRSFWTSRTFARQSQAARGKSDQGERGGVTAGKNMDGFLTLVSDIIKANGLANAEIHTERSLVTLPGFFRPTKLWDLLVMHRGELIVAIELKSQVGPSFGNNFNNRAEEAIGAGHDVWTAFREKAFGYQPPPFVGWMILVEDAPKSRRPVKDKSIHFPVFEEFVDATYLTRYDLLCQKLIREQLYTAAAVIASPKTAVTNGEYTCLSPMTDLRSVISSLAGHVASAAARLA